MHILIVIILGTSLLFGVVCMLITTRKGHPALVGFVLGFLFSIFGLVIVLLMKRSADVASPPMPPPNPSGEWRTDPAGKHQLRFWDGLQWTEHVRDGEQVSLDPLT